MPSVIVVVFFLALTACLPAAETSLYDEALASYQRKQYSKALSLAGKAVEADAGNPACLHLYGAILAELGQPAQAEDYFSKAVALKPDEPKYVSDLGALLHSEKKYAEAVPLLKRAVELAPDDLTARMMLARSYVFSFNQLKLPNFVDLTLEQLNYIVAKDPRFPAVHHHLALVYINTGDLEKAERELRTELRYSPQNPQVRLELGETLIKLNQNAKAIEELEIASKQAPTVPPIYYSLGKAYRAEGQTANALRATRRCVELDPRVPTCHYMLGQIYRELHDAEKAREQFQIFQQLSPASAPAN